MPSQDAGDYEHLVGGLAPGDDEIHSTIQEGTQADEASLAGLSQEWAADDSHEEWEEALDDVEEEEYEDDEIETSVTIDVDVEDEATVADEATTGKKGKAKGGCGVSLTSPLAYASASKLSQSMDHRRLRASGLPLV